MKYSACVPIMLLQTIVFLVKLIEETEPDQLVEYLTSLATHPLIPDEISDIDFRDAAHEMLKLKIQYIQNLIKAGNASTRHTKRRPFSCKNISDQLLSMSDGLEDGKP